MGKGTLQLQSLYSCFQFLATTVLVPTMGQLLCYVLYLKYSSLGNSLAVQWLGLGAFTARARVQSLVRKRRSHKPRGVAKKKIEKTPPSHSAGTIPTLQMRKWRPSWSQGPFAPSSSPGPQRAPGASCLGQTDGEPDFCAQGRT